MAIKTFPHAVIFDGKFYLANTPIKIKDSIEKIEAAKPTKKAVISNDKGTSRKA